MQLSYLMYRSEMRRGLKPEQILDIVARSVRNNPLEGLTGFLHTDETSFLQYIEGPPNPLRRKVMQIRKDPRHTNFRILTEGTQDRRLFPNWDMGHIPASMLPSEGALVRKGWLRTRLEVDPSEVLEAFALYADVTHGAFVLRH